MNIRKRVKLTMTVIIVMTNNYKAMHHNLARIANSFRESSHKKYDAGPIAKPKSESYVTLTVEVILNIF